VGKVRIEYVKDRLYRNAVVGLTIQGNAMKKIGIDYDGTIADTSGVKAHWLRERMGIEVPPWRTDRTHCVPIIGLENYERMSKFVYGRKGSLQAKEVPGSIDAIKELARFSQLFILTARPSHRIRWCKEWLRKKGIHSFIHAYFSRTGISADGSELTKPQLCGDYGIHVLIDDDERHLRGPELPNLKKILFKNGCNVPVDDPEEIELARSWPDVLRILQVQLFAHGWE
jgi:hypothetical protein